MGFLRAVLSCALAALAALAGCSPKPVRSPSGCDDARFDAPVSTYSFSSTGLLATLHRDGTLRLWQIAERRLKASRKLVGSPLRVAWLGAEGALLVDDAASRGAPRIIGSGADSGQAPAPDGYRLIETQRGVEAVRSLGQGRVELITALGSRELSLPAELAKGDQRALAFAPDGSAVAVAVPSKRSIQVWRTGDGQTPSVELGAPWVPATASELVLPAGSERLGLVGYSSSAERFSGMTIDVFDLQRLPGKPTFHWAADDHGGGELPESVMLSPDGGLLAILDREGLHVHDTGSGELAWDFGASERRAGEVPSLASAIFGAGELVAETSDGRLLVLGAADGVLRGPLQQCGAP